MLAKSPEAQKAAKRTEKRTHEAADSKYPKLDQFEAQIQNYLDRFKEIMDRNDQKDRKRGINALKKILIDSYVVRVEDIPESYWQAQMRVVRSRGEAGDWQELSEEQKLKIKLEHLVQTKEDQKGSLEEWIDYLASEKSSYLPDYLKYWAFQGMLRLERYKKGDKEKGISGKFPERSTGKQRSVKMFPEVNDRVLEFIAKAYKAQSENKDISFRYDIPEEARQAFRKHLEQKDFRALYGWGQEYLPPISEEEMQITEGQWVVYEQGSEPKNLTETLQGKGSGWCIAGEQIAGQYLESGNLHIYYTRDRDGQFSIPRVVVVEKDKKVMEVRGIEWEENVDKYIKESNIISDKLKTFPGGEEFFEIDRDMKFLTAIDKKISARVPLSREELVFIYEIDRPIKYFGLQKDPRIEEIRKTRKPKEDAPIVFECQPEEIAWKQEDITGNTKAYIGRLESGIFDLIQKYNIEHIYTSFPEGKIDQGKIEIGGMTEEELKKEIENKKDEQGRNYQISSYAESMMKHKDFTVSIQERLKNPETIDLVRLKVRDLGFTENPTTDELYKRAEELGLELCPPEVGPHLRLKYEEVFQREQPMYEYLRIAMKQIFGSGGDLSVFRVRRSDDGFWLGISWTNPSNRWHLDHEFVFRLRK